jgi:hypothetical protein
MSLLPDGKVVPYVANVLNRTQTGVHLEPFLKNMHGHKPHIQNAIDAQLLLSCVYFRTSGRVLNGYKRLYFPAPCAGFQSSQVKMFLSGWTEDCSYRSVVAE